MEVDYLIVGQGLAGTALGWHLLERGARVLVVDREEAVTSSRVAAGIMTPITGIRLAKSWRIDAFWPYGKRFYRRLEEKLGAAFFHETPIVRVFRSEAEAALWRKRLAESRDAYGPYVSDESEIASGIGPVTAPFGGFAMRNCGYLDVRRYLEVSRAFFSGENNYREGAFDHDTFDPAAGALEWNGVRVAKAVISCVGHVAAASRFFDWVPFKSAKGEILTVEMEGVREDRILNRGNWLLPLGGGGVFRTGTTYEWEQLDARPTSAGRREIETNLRALVTADYRVVDHVAAVRPIIDESKVLMGRHPAYPRLCFFNGLGSKGVLNSPFFANQFAAHLEEGAPIEGGVDLRKNF